MAELLVELLHQVADMVAVDAAVEPRQRLADFLQRAVDDAHVVEVADARSLEFLEALELQPSEVGLDRPALPVPVGPDDLGFSGNQQDYYDPRNSYVNEVLKRRLGIPITLSLVYMEVGRRIGVPMVGVGLPGHFLMRHAEEPGLFVDAFHGGLLLSREECVQRFRDLTHPDEPWSDQYLAPIGKRDMLTRMLRNLKVAHLRRKDNERALFTATMLIRLRPDLAEERRDRGVVQSRLGRYEEAIEDLRGYLDQAPASADAEAVRELVDHLKRLLER